MDDLKRKLISEIEAAFSTGTPPQPDKDNISKICSDDEGTAEYFAERTWRGHTAKQLRELDFALTVLTPQAFAYYLPAYLIADIEDPEEADIIIDSLMYHLSSSMSPDRSQAIRSYLSSEQKDAVRRYFEYARQREERGIFDDEFRELIDSFKNS